MTALLAKVRFLGWSMPDWTSLPPSFVGLFEAMDLGFQQGQQDRERQQREAAMIDDVAAKATKAARDIAMGQKTTL